MFYSGIILYSGILLTALVISLLSYRAVNFRNALIKAALYHYFMNHTKAEKETRVKDTSPPSVAYGMAIGKFQKMNDDPEDQAFCIDVLKHQVEAFGGQTEMLRAARRRHFPK
jgi:hypothetical protein